MRDSFSLGKTLPQSPYNTELTSHTHRNAIAFLLLTESTHRK